MFLDENFAEGGGGLKISFNIWHHLWMATKRFLFNNHFKKSKIKNSE